MWKIISAELVYNKFRLLLAGICALALYFLSILQILDDVAIGMMWLPIVFMFLSYLKFRSSKNETGFCTGFRFH